MDTMTIAVAGVAAMAILLIAAGIATSGGGSGISARLERYASGKPDQKAGAGGQGLGDMLTQSAAMTQFNKVVEAATSAPTWPARSPGPT